MVGVDGLVDIGEGLGLHALGGVHDKQRAFDGFHAPRYFVGEVYMAGRVDQVEDIGLPILRLVFEAHGLRLDGYAALPFDIHAVEQLFLHIPVLHRSGLLDQPVGERGFAVVDMRHDGEVADARKLGHGRDMRGKREAVKRGLAPRARRGNCRRHGG